MLFDALEQPGAGEATLRFIPGPDRIYSGHDLADASRRAATWLRELGGDAGTVAAVLSASFDTAAVVLGALRGGVRLASLPLPSKGLGIEEYVEQIVRMCVTVGARCVLVDGQYVPALRQYAAALGSTGLVVEGFDGWPRYGMASDEVVAGALVQFSSGSTGDPQGVVLTLEALEANVAAMMSFYQPRAREVVCSWLPWSHDMGLIGMLLTPICSLSPPWACIGHGMYIAPERFVVDPGVWLRTCSEIGATFTAAAPFGLNLARRRLRRDRGLDLSAMRAVVIGSEMIGARGLREFEQAAGEVGLPRRSLCPAYGLAEATLGVTIVPIETTWAAETVDVTGLESGRWVPTEAGGREVVSCGPALPRVEVRVAEGRPVGELEIRSPSLLATYAGSEDVVVDADGWFRTSDLGHLTSAGELFPLGRVDDVCIVGGRKIYLADIDRVVEGHPITRPGGAAAVSVEAGEIVVIAEARRASASRSVLVDACREIRGQVIRHCGVGPSRVVITEGGAIPKTPSGKIRRNRLGVLVSEETLPLLGEL
jgi:fatty-acyl-CoA synthase